MKQIVTILLSIIAGASFGVSIGLGFFPVFKGDKNFKIQLDLAMVACVTLALILIILL